MFTTKKVPEYDFLVHERIDILDKQGYCGFNISKIDGNIHSEDIIVEATNHQGITLTCKGSTKEDAFKKMIDLIDVTVGDF